MTPRLRLATLAAMLALLLSAAAVPFVYDWQHISQTTLIDDPAHAGRVKHNLVVFPIYWFYVAAGVGCFLASYIALGSGEGLRARSLVFFLVLSDIIYAWIGGIGFMLSMVLLAPDTITLQPLSTFDRMVKWAELPIMGLMVGLLFGNLQTSGFGFLIGLPTILWLGARRLFTKNLRSRSAENSN
jgi:hypothetical protein